MKKLIYLLLFIPAFVNAQVNAVVQKIPATGTLYAKTGTSPVVLDTLAQTYGTFSTGQTLVWNNTLKKFVAATPVSITPAALTKTDDTNVTLTLGGTPGTALLQGVSITAGWTGTLADGRIASAATWNAKQNAITFGTGVLSALANNIGSAGAPLLYNGAGGTPSAIVLTNGTGLPLTTGTTGLLPLSKGGTNTDLSATGGAGQFLRQSSTGAAVTVGAIVAGDLPSLSGTYIPVAGSTTITGYKSFSLGALMNDYITLTDGASGLASSGGYVTSYESGTTQRMHPVSGATNIKMRFDAPAGSQWGTLVFNSSGGFFENQTTGQPLAWDNAGAVTALASVSAPSLSVTGTGSAGFIDMKWAVPSTPAASTTRLAMNAVGNLNLISPSGFNAIFTLNGNTASHAYTFQDGDGVVGFNPFTTTGDIAYSSTTGTYGAASRLGIGSSGQVLTVSGGVPSWATPTVYAPLVTYTNNTIYKGNGTTTQVAASLTDDGTTVSTTLPLSVPTIYNSTTSTNVLTLKNYSGAAALNSATLNANGLGVSANTSAGSVFRVGGTVTNSASNINHAIINPSFAYTSTSTNQNIALFINPSIGASNTAAFGQYKGVRINPTASNSATGAVDFLYGLEITGGIGTGMTTQKTIGLIIGDMGATNSPIVSGIHLVEQSTSANRANISIGVTPGQIGAWNLFLESANKNYLGTGNTLIGSSTSTAGAEELQVTGATSISTDLVLPGLPAQTTPTVFYTKSGSGTKVSESTVAQMQTALGVGAYSEGTWTPASSTVTLTVANADYQRTGNIINAFFYITFPVSASTNPVTITGLPGAPYNYYPVNFSGQTNAGLVLRGTTFTTGGTFTLTDISGVAITYAQMSGKIMAGSALYRSN